MAKVYYIPAIGMQFVLMWIKNEPYVGKDGKAYDMKFFTENSHFTWPYALQSAYYGIIDEKRNDGKLFRDLIGYPKDKLLYGDSGGFQMATFARDGKKCDMTALESLRWQEANVDVAMNLDIPPNLFGPIDYEEFKKCLAQSKANFALFEKERRNYNMKLLNVLHGKNYELMDIWYNEVKHFNFDGWAMSAKPAGDPFIKAAQFIYLFEKGEFEKESCKFIHFFGTSGKHVSPVMVYCGSKIKRKDIVITYDSSSYNTGSIYREYYAPLDIGPALSFGEKFKINNPHLKTLFCRCPVCLNVNDIQDLNTKHIHAGTLICLHNLYQYVYYNDILNELVEDKELYLNYLKSIGISDRALMTLEFIDFALEKGLQVALKKYENYIINQDVTKSKQVDIFGF